MTIFIELTIVLASILIGARVGGLGLGTVAGMGLMVLVFLFGLPPGVPPRTVLGMILCVITAAAAMQAAGGLDYLVVLAERALRTRPAAITFLAPVVAYAFTFLAGTGHVAYALFPVIAEVARKAGVRPERPMSIAAIASQQAITASPISAATVALLGLLSPTGIGLREILMISIPATFVGCLLGALAVSRVGPELADDPEYRRRLEEGEVSDAEAPAVTLEGAELTRAKGSVIVFALAVITVVTLGLIPSLRPRYTIVDNGTESVEQLALAPAIMITMLAAAGIIMMAFKVTGEKTLKTPVMGSGFVALISIAGLGWMGSSFFEGNRAAIVGAISSVIQGNPWLFAVGLFALSVLLFSQAATVTTLVPVGVALGLSGGSLIAMFPAVNGYFFLPTYGTLLAAISFDQTGTTKIGRYVLNHSFMIPGLVATISAIVIGFLLARVVI
jgi:anaerobic C4-dicarboxylate transporter DcuA